MKKQKNPNYKIPFSECQAHINIIGPGGGEYGSAFLNIQLPDGRWVAFKSIPEERIPLQLSKTEKEK